jgi:hypothetical protein
VGSVCIYIKESIFMPIHRKAWLSALPFLFLTAACGQSRAPTDVATQLEAGAATSAAECEAKIDVLRGSTLAAPITGKNSEKDRTGLVKKLDNASEALSLGKNAGAVEKLNDYILKVRQLKEAGKLDATSADGLIAQANDANHCVNGIDV